ncbi:MAG: methyltransferase family protein [Promethearchaeota archaeon]
MESNQYRSNDKGKKFRVGNIIFTSIFTISFIIQIILMFLFFNELGLIILIYIGCIIWVFSLYFGFITIWTFKKKGGVEKGKSYMYTTELVVRGPYAIVRHPQYLGGILFTISITLWTQLFISLVLSIIIIILTYQWTYVEDKNLVDKFGEDYMKYKEKVPRLNFILGLIKYKTSKQNY